MPKYRKKIRSGDVYEVEEFYSPRTIGKKYERANRQKENDTHYQCQFQWG